MKYAFGAVLCIKKPFISLIIKWKIGKANKSEAFVDKI